MKLGLIQSAWFGSSFEGKAGLLKSREIGFDCVDIFADPLALTDQQYRQLLLDVQAAGLPVPSVVCVALGITDFNLAPQRFHVERVRRHIDLASDLAAQNVLLVLGEYIWQQEVIPAQQQWDTAVNNVRTLGIYAAQKGLEIALELEPFQQSLINSIDTMSRFLTEVDHPAVKANIDCSHLWLRRIDASEIRRLEKRIAHVHISDCNGHVHGDLPPGRGNTPLINYLEKIAATGYDGVVSVELEYAPPSEQIVAWVSEAYTSTAHLLRELGLRAM